MEQQQYHPDATGALTDILYDVALAAKIIASRTTRAALVGILGNTGEENIQGEIVQKLDSFAQRTIYRLNDHTGRLAVMASEEEEHIIPIPTAFPLGTCWSSTRWTAHPTSTTTSASAHRHLPASRRLTRGTLADCL